MLLFRYVVCNELAEQIDFAVELDFFGKSYPIVWACYEQVEITTDMKKNHIAAFCLVIILSVLLSAFTFAHAAMNPEWGIAGTGDFNGDDSPDILWKNHATGELSIWYMRGSTVIGEQKIKHVPHVDWDIEGIADFNSDGAPELLARDPLTGITQIWSLDGTAITVLETIGVVNSSYGFGGIGDFNKDGIPDILWREQATGKSIVWYVDGVKVKEIGFLATLPSPWHIVGIKDFNGDGSLDILWGNATTGDFSVWYMDGLAHLAMDSIAAPQASPRFDIPCNGNQIENITTVPPCIILPSSLSLEFPASPDFAPVGSYTIRGPPNSINA